MAKQYPEIKKKWVENNKEKVKHNDYRSKARVFLRDMATEEESKEMKEIIEKRLTSTYVDDTISM